MLLLPIFLGVYFHVFIRRGANFELENLRIHVRGCVAEDWCMEITLIYWVSPLWPFRVCVENRANQFHAKHGHLHANDILIHSTRSGSSAWNILLYKRVYLVAGMNGVWISKCNPNIGGVLMGIRQWWIQGAIWPSLFRLYEKRVNFWGKRWFASL